jgi:CubicO group peptidase (beta-lactamase class C family)
VISYPLPDVEIVSVSGFAEPPFEPLREAFGRVVAAQGGGAALAVYRHGRPVVDLTGGEYRLDSLQLIFSISKAVTAVAAAMAHDEGLIDLDAPLGDYWPAFARSSTAAITARSVLSHRSGLASLDQQLSIDDIVAGKDEEAVERQEPFWTPGTRHGYHSFTFGPLLNGAFKRTVGSTVREFVADRLAKPLNLDLWIGVPADKLNRVERVRFQAPKLTPERVDFNQQTAIPPGTTAQLARKMDVYNSRALLTGGLPSTGGVAGARDLARLMYATFDEVDGVRILSSRAHAAMIASQSRGFDAVLGFPTHFGSGVQLAFPVLPFLGPGSYGHEAAGGSGAFADVDYGVAVGFITNCHPPIAGASGGFLALLSSIRHCLTADQSAI